MSAASSAGSGRAQRIDMLRGAAVFGILLVNVWSYVWGFESLRYGVLPPDASTLDAASIFFVAFFAEQKFYPILAFLFGAGFALHTRQLRKRLPDWLSVRRAYRRRLWWLIACGFLHGSLVWFGDILTVYGLAGFLIVPLAGARLRSVRKFLLAWLLIWLIQIVFNAGMTLSAQGQEDITAFAASARVEVEQSKQIYTAGSVADIARQRVSDYVDVTTQSIWLLPHLMLLFSLGILAARLGWLTRADRYRRMWHRLCIGGFAVGLPLCLLWGWAALAEARSPGGDAVFAYAAFALLPIGGTCLAAAYVGAMMSLSGHAFQCCVRWLAPAGRMALTNYLMQSVIGTVLIQASGAALGARLSASGLLSFALALIAAQIYLSRRYFQTYAIGPVEWIYRAQTAVKSQD